MAKQLYCIVVSTALACLALTASVNASPNVRLTVSYCPGLFAGLGAVVSVDPNGGGAFDIVQGGWKWPDSGGVGCPENEDPNMLATSSGSMLLDFTTNFGFMVEVDAANSGNVTHAVTATSTNALAFDGFTSWAVQDGDFVGITPAASQHGFCSDGCFAYGTETWPAGVYTQQQLVPFKAAMTNVAFLDTSGTYYFQGSYPLVSKWACSETQSDECLVALDAGTGDIISSVGPNSYTVYSFHSTASQDGTVLAFVFGFEDKCKHPYNDFAFANVNLTSGEASFIACMDKSVSINTNPNVGNFSPDGKLFATGSGNSETGEVQLIVLDTATGAKVLDSTLPGLKTALKVSKQAPFINVWGISWA